MAKYLDGTGVTYLWSQIKSWVTTHIKLTSVTSGGVTTNTLSIGNDDVDIPNSTSQLINDSGFITSADVPEGAVASTTTPKMDGTAAVGTETAFARGDHIHPSDTSKVTANSAITGATKTKITYDSKGLVTAGADLSASDIPSITLSKISDVTASASELNILDGVTASTSELNILDGVTASTAELNYVDGVTSNIQTQLNGKINSTAIGAANGVCPLDSTSKISSQYLPSYVDDVIEAYIRTGQTALSSTWLATGSASGTTITPETGKIYIIMNGTDTYPTGSQYRWGGSAYVKLNDGGVSALTNPEIDAAIAAAD